MEDLVVAVMESLAESARRKPRRSVHRRLAETPSPPQFTGVTRTTHGGARVNP
jgi:hypothetical protein